VKLFSFLKGFYQKYKVLVLGLLSLALCLFTALVYELRTSRFQSRYFAAAGRELTYLLKPGPSKNIRFPDEGPHDIRLGYTRIPGIVRNLSKEGYFVQAQAEMSKRLSGLIDSGLFAIYHEKTQAGLKVVDKNGEMIYAISRPERVYSSFRNIPAIVINTILYIENREILDAKFPYKNPAVEWDRFALAIFQKILQFIIPGHSAPGGSTIATQLEKYLHGFEGRTSGVGDKLRQMLSASYRAYLDGEKTFGTREKIVLNYINSIPLAALRGYGEVNGLGDGLSAWYGVDVAESDRLLMDYTYENAKNNPNKYAERYKQVLSLFIAHRRPSYYLLSDSANLNGLTDEYLYLVTEYKLIPPELRDAALKIKLKLKTSAPPIAPVSFVQRKAANSIRTKLLSVMKFRQLYDMDQVDLSVQASLDKKINEAVSEVLTSLKEKKNVEKFNMVGERTLNRGDPAKVIYSVTLYERVRNVNLLRIQTDNLDRPFDINEGTRLDLGSTAKLRTLANYLEIISILHEKYSAYDKTRLQKSLASDLDPLSQWVANKVKENPKITLQETLDGAMLREYSANPGESFFTGGGVHTFENFKNEDNGKVFTVQTALQQSINLSFIRIMRDNLRYYVHQLSGEESGLSSGKETKRQQYLAKFADKEGSYFIENFYQKYKGHSSSEVLGVFLKGLRPSARRLTAIFRQIKPQQGVAELKEFLEFHLPKSSISDKQIQSMYDELAPGKFSINDQGYIARVHPLELWLVGYLVNHPNAKLADALEASKDERQDVYKWLMLKKNRHAQDIRIRSIIEAEAFREMHKSWKRFGYPFQSMVPSFASAIGSSGDRPAALAELMGIILNNGVRYPMQRMERLHFAEGTPFETIISLNKDSEGERVMTSEEAAVLRRALRDVVENGTARRVDKAFKTPDGKVIPVGGKTGTGDNRFETFGKGGQLISSRVVNRTATFVFYIGDRFFGTVTAHVEGPEAGNYAFTSALAAELLKGLAPAISPLVNNPQDK